MWAWKGFKTEAQAKAFQRKNGGAIYYEKRSLKTKKLTTIGKEYLMIAMAAGFDKESNPYIVTWRERG